MDLYPSELIEEWRPIPGYEGLYEASNLGRVRSAPGKVTSSSRFPHRTWAVRIMKPKYPRSRKRQDGRLSLWKDGRVKDHLVSRLIASAWLGPPADGMTVNHIDGDYTNNSPCNLEWISLSENIKKGFRDGLYDSIEHPIKIVDKNGIAHTFRSMAAASEWLGRNTGYVSYAVSKGRNTATDANGEKYAIYSQ